jgi:phage shock protein A
MAGVSPDAYYDECNRNPEFLQKMQRAQEYVSSLADRVIAKAIKDGDSSTAKRFKERIDERYKKENTIKMSANSETDPETGEVVT